MSGILVVQMFFHERFMISLLLPPPKRECFSTSAVSLCDVDLTGDGPRVSSMLLSSSSSSKLVRSSRGLCIAVS